MFVCVAGKNNIAVDVLEYLKENCRGRYGLGVICNKTETGKNGFQKSLRFWANKFGITEYTLEDVYEKKELVFISLEFDRLVKPELFTEARLYNIHFSLLPRYKGMYTSAIPILNGEKYVGVTLHKIDCGIDTGDIIAQQQFPVQDYYTCRDLYIKYIEQGTKLMLQNIESLISGCVYAEEQKCEDSTYYSKKYRDYSNIKIDLRQTATGIDRQIRAYSFREYQLPIVYGEKIISTHITKTKSFAKPGTILAQTNMGMLIATIDYNIILYIDRFEELLQACRVGDIQRVKEICEVDSHVNVADIHGWTPLIVATYNNHKDIVKYLLLRGADIFVKNNNGTNLLMYAKEAYLKSGDNELFKLFESLGLSVQECDYMGRDLTYYLALQGRTVAEIMK